MFFKKKTEKETYTPQGKAEILKQLREKYRKAASRYDAKRFDAKKLEERITYQRVTSADFERFILDEMAFFKKMETAAEEEVQKRARQEEAERRMQEIMAANDARIAHYADTFFHPLATLECRRIVGALSGLFPEIENDLRYVFQGTKPWGEMKFHLADLERFVYKPPMRMTAFLAAYIAELQKWGETGRDDADRKFLQTAAMCLTQLAQEIQKGLDGLSQDDATRASRVQARLEAIVADFRLTEWAAHGLSLGKKPE